MEPLKECPFCGKESGQTTETFVDAYESLFSVECLVCGATGPTGWTHDEATTLWQGRRDA